MSLQHAEDMRISTRGALRSPRVTSPAPRAAWDELAAVDRTGLVTQTAAWTACLRAATGARDVSRLYDFGGRRLLLPLVRMPWRPLFDSSLPPAWGFGGLLGGEPTPAEVAAVFADLRSRPTIGVRIRPNPLQAATWEAARPDGVRAIARRAHAIDLTRGFDDVWANGFSGRARNHVRRAERAGVTVQRDTGGRLVPVFYDLFMRSVERWAGRQHEPRTLALWRARRRDPIEKLQRIVAGMGDSCRLLVAFAGDRPAAAILVLQGANAHYTRGAMDVEVAGPSRANYLLHRTAIEDAAAAGCSAYHMGETGRSRSLAQFKEALGARPHDYAEYVAERLPLTSIDRALRTAAKRALRFRDDG